MLPRGARERPALPRRSVLHHRQRSANYIVYREGESREPSPPLKRDPNNPRRGGVGREPPLQVLET